MPAFLAGVAFGPIDAILLQAREWRDGGDEYTEFSDVWLFKVNGLIEWFRADLLGLDAARYRNPNGQGWVRVTKTICEGTTRRDAHLLAPADGPLMAYES